tara:strand:- start:90 stop:440 length:351 start_codon:yes stop_codon:yes gene_type:complete
MVKTYACNTAIIISKPVNIITKDNGAHPPKKPSKTIKEAKTFSIVCPAIIFANNLKLKLIGRTKYEIISIGISIGRSAYGTPLGTKNFKKLIPCFIKPMNVTAMNINPASPKVTIM